jgi:hypothetical protein
VWLADLVDKNYRTVQQWRAEPRCGEDFCDWCGDCLRCYGNDPCPRGGEHAWVIYADQAAEWHELHPEAIPREEST